VASAATQGWTQQPVPLPAGAASGSLTTVSCLSADYCLAGGYYQTTRYGYHHLLGEQWDGSSWQVLPFAPPPSKLAQLSQVMCVTTSSCFMVGSYTDESTLQDLPLVEHWDGSTWTVQAVPAVDGLGGLYGISCPAADDCIAVGSTLSANGKDAVPLADRWDGSSWAQQPVPRPKSTGVQYGVDSYLLSVSCSSGANCTAVGRIGVDKVQSLAEHWNGSHWTIQPTPAPAGAKYSLLDGVSCPKAAFCLATGYSDTNPGGLNPDTAIAEIWTGDGWTQQTLPLPAKSLTSILNGISCASAVRCTAVGYVNSLPHTSALAEYWTGSAWAVQPTALPRALRSLNDISCTGPRVCTAVGSINARPPLLAENENV
jgi:hypothetical protein